MVSCTHIITEQDAIELCDPTTRRTYRYETFHPQGTAAYSPDVCEKLQNSGILDRWEEVPEDEELPNGGASTQNSEDGFVDVVTHKPSGVADILITGKVSSWYFWCTFFWLKSYPDRRTTWRCLGSFQYHWTSTALGWLDSIATHSRMLFSTLFLL